MFSKSFRSTGSAQPCTDAPPSRHSGVRAAAHQVRQFAFTRSCLPTIRSISTIRWQSTCRCRSRRRQARILMLSANNILKPSDGRPVTVPSQDMVIGLYHLTSQRDDEVARRYFTSPRAEMAYDLGELHLNAPCHSLEGRRNRSSPWMGGPGEFMKRATMCCSQRLWVAHSSMMHFDHVPIRESHC